MCDIYDISTLRMPLMIILNVVFYVWTYVEKGLFFPSQRLSWRLGKGDLYSICLCAFISWRVNFRLRAFLLSQLWPLHSKSRRKDEILYIACGGLYQTSKNIYCIACKCSYHFIPGVMQRRPPMRLDNLAKPCNASFSTNTFRCHPFQVARIAVDTWPCHGATCSVLNLILAMRHGFYRQHSCGNSGRGSKRWFDLILHRDGIDTTSLKLAESLNKWHAPKELAFQTPHLFI